LFPKAIQYRIKTAPICWFVKSTSDSAFARCENIPFILIDSNSYDFSMNCSAIVPMDTDSFHAGYRFFKWTSAVFRISFATAAIAIDLSIDELVISISWVINSAI